MKRLRIIAKGNAKKTIIKPFLQNNKHILPANPYTRFYKKERSFAELLPSRKQK